MSTELQKIKKELLELKLKSGLYHKVFCEEKDNKQYAEILKQNGKLPDGIYRYIDLYGDPTNEFYIISDSALTEQELREYTYLKSIRNMKVIKNIVGFIAITSFLILVICVLFFISLIS